MRRSSPPGLLTGTGLHGPTPRSTSAATGRGCAAGCLLGRGTPLLWYELHAFSGEGLAASCLSPRSRARTHAGSVCDRMCDLVRLITGCSNDSMPDVRFLSCLYSYHGRFTANEVNSVLLLILVWDADAHFNYFWLTTKLCIKKIVYVCNTNSYIFGLIINKKKLILNNSVLRDFELSATKYQKWHYLHDIL